MTAAVLCLVLGAGLLGGAAAGVWLTTPETEADSAERLFEERRSLWRELPVEAIFPTELAGEGAGPGGADRHWSRVAVAPDSDCVDAFDPALGDLLADVGCHRLLRATYVDDTESAVTTVGLVFTEADPAGMLALARDIDTDDLDARADLLPRPRAGAHPAAIGFGDRQRATWTLRALTDVPVVVWAVSGFADGRAVPEPVPAAEAVEKGADSAAALAGLGHEAIGITDRIERRLRRAAAGLVEENDAAAAAPTASFIPLLIRSAGHTDRSHPAVAAGPVPPVGGLA
ncbi:hypothetical protein [Streptomyces sp. ST2-7A]|uniref:hypothetical protein n=1 Tax=Streptomyces sp. ST2-7A TaxID=2907214 RepID=UPI001F37CA2E|nr:hypothetical protein [Streptomyces sp. ST2-7A]MCE7082595.1 hypothetical protein [Streptomyces sp. ST2-7A]